MRDIVQVSTVIVNPVTGKTAAGATILPIILVVEDDGFLDFEGYLYDLSELFDDGELWN